MTIYLSMKPLSPNNVLNALLYPVLLLLMVTGLLMTPADLVWMKNKSVVVLIYIVLIAWIYLASRATYNLRYDMEFLYMKGVMKTTKIPLSAIIKVQRTTDRIKVYGLSSWRYTVEFDSSAKMPSQVVYETVGSKKVEEFVEVVRRLNPNVVVG